MMSTHPIVSVLSVVVKQGPDQHLLVHTQTRNVLDKEYDFLYDKTQETVGETVHAGESLVEAAVRGCREELGSPALRPVMMLGADQEVFSTRPGEDEMLGLLPWYVVQQMRGPQAWIGFVFIVEVPPDFEPEQDEHREVGAHQWWEAPDLLKELRENPAAFMGLHYPALLRACERHDEITHMLDR